MRRFRSRQLVVLTAVALSTWTCTTTTTPTVTTPTTPAVNVTEVFSAQLAPGGSVTFSFTANAAGAINATLTSITPDSTLTLGLAIGVLSGTTCEVKITNDLAVQGTTVIGIAGAASSFCARVYDAAGVVTAPETVSVTVTHF